MKALVIYDSQFGNTEQIAREIGTELGMNGWARVISVSDFETPDLAGVELLVVGGPTQIHGVSPNMRQFLDFLPSSALHGVNAAAFDTRVSGMKLLTGSAADGIAKRLTKHGANLVDKPVSYLVTGREGPLAEGELERASAWAKVLLEAVGEHVAV